MVRVPVELHEELARLAESFLRLYAEGRTDLPPEFVDANFVPRWYVIQKGVESVIGKRKRSNRRRPRKAVADEGCKQGSRLGGA